MRTINILLMGPPGAGKGTQAESIVAEYKIPHIATGDIFREAVANKTELGMKAKEYMDAGQLVPDEVTIGIVRERLAQKDCEKGFLLDGFPRTLVQAEALDRIMREMGKRIEMVINITVPREILVQRMTGRLTCKNCKAVYHREFNPPKLEGVCDKCGGELIQRSDDQEATARKRLEVYMEETDPVLNYYQKQGILLNVEGNRARQEVFNEIKKALELLAK